MLPFQTSAGTVTLRAYPEAVFHVILLLREVVEGCLAEEPVAHKRFGPLTMHLRNMFIKIVLVSEGLSTGLTQIVLRGRSFLPWLITNSRLRLNWN